MTAEALRRDPGNAVVAIANFARSLPVTALLIIEALGLSAILIVFAGAPHQWPLMLPCTAVTCFAVWGICDRWKSSLLSHRQKLQRRILRIAARLVAATGILAALLSVYLLIGWMMGVYIS